MPERDRAGAQVDDGGRSSPFLTARLQLAHRFYADGKVRACAPALL